MSRLYPWDLHTRLCMASGYDSEHHQRCLEILQAAVAENPDQVFGRCSSGRTLLEDMVFSSTTFFGLRAVEWLAASHAGRLRGFQCRTGCFRHFEVLRAALAAGVVVDFDTVLETGDVRTMLTLRSATECLDAVVERAQRGHAWDGFDRFWAVINLLKLGAVPEPRHAWRSEAVRFWLNRRAEADRFEFSDAAKPAPARCPTC